MTIFKQSMKRILSSKLKLLILFLGPVLFTLMFVSTVKSSLIIVVADNDKSALSERLVSELKGLDKMTVTELPEGEINDRVISYQADEAIILPKGFGDAILGGKDAEAQVFHILENEKIFYVSAFIDTYVSDMKTLAAGAGYDRNAFGKALAAYDAKRLSVQNMAQADGNTAIWSRGSLGFLVQFMLYMSIITAGVILEDKSSGVYYRTFFAPVTLKRYYAENLLAYLIVGMAQAMIAIVIVTTLLGMNVGNMLAISVLFCVFALVCVALGMWLITLFKKPLLAYLSILFLTTPLVMLGGCYWPANFMPDTIVKIAKFFPTSWVMQAVDKILNNGANLGGIGLEILMLLLFAGVFLAAGLVKKVDIAK